MDLLISFIIKTTRNNKTKALKDIPTPVQIPFSKTLATLVKSKISLIPNAIAKKVIVYIIVSFKSFKNFHPLFKDSLPISNSTAQ